MFKIVFGKHGVVQYEMNLLLVQSKINSEDYLPFLSSLKETYSKNPRTFPFSIKMYVRYRLFQPLQSWEYFNFNKNFILFCAYEQKINLDRKCDTKEKQWRLTGQY